MEGVEVPSFFLCPISLQIMRDPVTLPSGITYDRESIERWIFVNKRHTCPLTNQPLPVDVDFITPNHTLRRLIQSWCATNASEGFERFPTPRPPITKMEIGDLVEEARSNPNSLLDSLKKLKSIVWESERNRCSVESSGAVDFLVAMVRSAKEEVVVDEALNILCSLQISEQGLIHLLEKKEEDFIDTLTSILRKSNYQSRVHAALLIKSLISVIPSPCLANLKDEISIEMVRMLRDRISYQATKAALQVIGITTQCGRNKIATVNACAVPVLVELLVDENEKKISEMILVILSRLCECAEGREEMVSHALGIAVLSKRLVRVSVVASERAVRIIHSIARCSPNPRVLKEMLEVGVVSKLCLLAQVDCGEKTKQRVKEMLRLHARVWRNSPCISPQLQSSYPSS